MTKQLPKKDISLMPGIYTPNDAALAQRDADQQIYDTDIAALQQEVGRLKSQLPTPEETWAFAYRRKYRGQTSGEWSKLYDACAAKLKAIAGDTALASKEGEACPKRHGGKG